jgi:hypothetical protein
MKYNETLDSFVAALPAEKQTEYANLTTMLNKQRQSANIGIVAAGKTVCAMFAILPPRHHTALAERENVTRQTLYNWKRAYEWTLVSDEFKAILKKWQSNHAGGSLARGSVRGSTG